MALANWLTLSLVIDRLSMGGICVKVDVGGTSVKVDIGTAVSVGTTLVAGEQEARIKATSRIVMIFLIFIDTLF